MPLLLVTHESGLSHRTPQGHPERSDRLAATLEGLRGLDTTITEFVAPRAEPHALERIHDPSYVDEIHRFCLSGGGMIDQDTYVVRDSWEAALHAAGAGIGAVEMLDSGSPDTAFVAVRPPGHHAERHQAMGFCLFNNVAITAAYLKEQGQRVAIVDWDVHHGNGTQHSFWSDADVLYISLHEFPFYPGTGWITESGGEGGEGATVNIALPAGTTSDAYLAAFGRIAQPILEQFSPDWILVSAGYDAHARDPLGELNLESDDYKTLAGAIATVVPPNRVVSFLEGGYDLTALATASAASVEGVLAPPSEMVWPDQGSGSANRLIDLVATEMSRHWDVY